MIFGDVLLTAQ